MTLAAMQNSNRILLIAVRILQVKFQWDGIYLNCAGMSIMSVPVKRSFGTLFAFYIRKP